jgi:hypothetical protein
MREIDHDNIHTPKERRRSKNHEARRMYQKEISKLSLSQSSATNHQPASDGQMVCIQTFEINNQHKGSEEKTLIDSQPKLLWRNKNNTDISCWAPLLMRGNVYRDEKVSWRAPTF